MSFKILFSNLGYARGIDGTLRQHIELAHRHFYTGLTQQHHVLSQFKSIITTEKPDLCCLVEIDSGSWQTGYFNQLNYLINEEYAMYSITSKYGDNSLLAQMPFFKGNCNAFLSKSEISYQKLHFKNGSKRLIYNLSLPGNIRLFFTHFSLQERVRAKQFEEMRKLVGVSAGEVIIVADFNILQGFRELQPLLKDKNLQVLNDEGDHTFMFGGKRFTLDLCVCSPRLALRANLRVIPQPFSDHAALLIDLKL